MQHENQRQLPTNEASNVPSTTAAGGTLHQTANRDEGSDQTISSTTTSKLWVVPWDIWTTIQTVALVLIVNQSLPYAGFAVVSQLQGVPLQDMGTAEQEYIKTIAQLLQLAATFVIVNTSTIQHKPLPQPWFTYNVNMWSLLQSVAAAVVALGSGVLVSGVMQGHSDGISEWHGLMASNTPETIAFILGAILLAPVTEEYICRGYLLPSLTKWTHPGVAVVLSGLLFAAIHPQPHFIPEALLGCILGAAMLSADGNLLVPTLAHALYNGVIVAAELADHVISNGQ